MWHAALSYPDKFAAIFPVAAAILGEQVTSAPNYRTPTWIWNGHGDRSSQRTNSITALRHLRSLNVPCRFTESSGPTIPIPSTNSVGLMNVSLIGCSPNHLPNSLPPSFLRKKKNQTKNYFPVPFQKVDFASQVLLSKPLSFLSKISQNPRNPPISSLSNLGRAMPSSLRSNRRMRLGFPEFTRNAHITIPLSLCPRKNSQSSR